MWVVMKRESLEFTCNLPFPVKYQGKMIGFLPLYETKEDALADYPTAIILEVKEVDRS